DGHLAGAGAPARGAAVPRVPDVPHDEPRGDLRTPAATGARAMSYLLLVAGLLAIAIVLRVAGAAAARRRGEGIPTLPTVLAGVVLVALTLVFDNVMIAAGLFAYADAHIS